MKAEKPNTSWHSMRIDNDLILRQRKKEWKRAEKGVK